MIQGKRVAILCSGGDCAGMNPAIKHFTDLALSKGIQPFGVSMGYTGLIRGDIRPLEHSDVSGILHCGGTVLGSSRCPEFREPVNRKVAKQQLDRLGIDSLIVLGGNGSFQGMEQFHLECGVAVGGIPATIDNDVFGSETTIGVDTALNVIRNSLDQIRDTASSFHRAFVVETMGRDCGYLALITALTSGAEVCLVPEVEYDLEAIEKRLALELEKGRTYLTAVVSEGISDGAERLTNLIEHQLNMVCRKTVLGHIQRGGCPTVLDRLHAFETVDVAMTALMEGQKSFAILFRRGTWHSVDLKEIKPELVSLPDSLKEMAIRLAN